MVSNTKLTIVNGLGSIFIKGHPMAAVYFVHRHGVTHGILETSAVALHVTSCNKQNVRSLPHIVHEWNTRTRRLDSALGHVVFGYLL